MCVIIDRDPGVTIPLDKLQIACRINAHGHGLAYVHRGRLRYEYDPGLNDPEAISAKLTRLASRRVYLHLRFATVGEVSSVNAHPFQLLTRKSHGVDLALMHNGTFGNYHPSGAAKDLKWSDTKFFTEVFVKPLAERCSAFLSGDATPLGDPFFVRQVAKESGNYSVVVLFDSLGNTLRINEERGTQFEGWWASNDYSFKDTHHRAAVGKAWCWDDDQTVVPFSRKSDWDGLPIHSARYPQIALTEIETWETELAGLDAADKEAAHRQSQLEYVKQAPYTLLQQQTAIVKQYVTTAVLDQPENSMKNLNSLFVSRPNFCKELEISDITDVANLPEETFVMLCKTQPHAMAQVFIELCGRVDTLRKTAAVATKNAR
jgi:hypothetical protein